MSSYLLHSFWIRVPSNTPYMEGSLRRLAGGGWGHHPPNHLAVAGSGTWLGVWAQVELIDATITGHNCWNCWSSPARHFDKATAKLPPHRQGRTICRSEEKLCLSAAHWWPPSPWHSVTSFGRLKSPWRMICPLLSGLQKNLGALKDCTPLWSVRTGQLSREMVKCEFF